MRRNEFLKKSIGGLTGVGFSSVSGKEKDRMPAEAFASIRSTFHFRQKRLHLFGEEVFIKEGAFK